MKHAAYILLALCVLFATSIAEAKPPLKSSLTGIPKVVPKDARLMFSVVRLADGALISSKSISRGKEFSLKAPPVASFISTVWFSRSKHVFLKGQSKLLAPGISISSALKIKRRSILSHLKNMPMLLIPNLNIS